MNNKQVYLTLKVLMSPEKEKLVFQKKDGDLPEERTIKEVMMTLVERIGATHS